MRNVKRSDYKCFEGLQGVAPARGECPKDRVLSLSASLSPFPPLPGCTIEDEEKKLLPTWCPLHSCQSPLLFSLSLSDSISADALVTP